MKNVLLVVSAFMLHVAVQPVRAQRPDAEAAVTRGVRAYFSAMGKGDIAAISDVLSEDYLVIGGDGKLETRGERIAWLRRNAASVDAIAPTEVRVRIYGSSAVATGLVLIPADRSGPPIRERFTQVWVRRGEKWRMVSGQITVVTQ